MWPWRVLTNHSKPGPRASLHFQVSLQGAPYYKENTPGTWTAQSLGPREREQLLRPECLCLPEMWVWVFHPLGASGPGPLHQVGHAEGSAAPGMCPLSLLPLSPEHCSSSRHTVTLGPTFFCSISSPPARNHRFAFLPQQLHPPCAALQMRSHCYPISSCRLQRCRQARASHGWGTLRISGSQILRRGKS